MTYTEKAPIGKNNRLRELAYWIHRHGSAISLFKDSLAALYQAREGGRLSQFLAAASITGNILRAVATEETVYSCLINDGYRAVDSPIDGFLGEMLEKEPTSRELTLGGATIRYWGPNQEVAAVFLEDGDMSCGPYVRGADPAHLYRLLSENVWALGSDLLIEENTENRLSPSSSGRFSLMPLPDPGPYVGTLDTTYYADRLRRYGSAPRTLLIEGPTRVGKSVLARHIARSLSSRSDRSLKVDGSTIAWWSSADLPCVVKYLQPSVLLIDDIDMGQASRLLGILENLRIEGSLVILTRMVPLDANTVRTPGDRYIEGMAPGRIDEIITLFPPDDQNRDLILRHYYSMVSIPVPRDHSEIVEKTIGLTGGYLAEFVKRIDVHGEECWRDELRSIRYFAPPPPPQPEREEDL